MLTATAWAEEATAPEAVAAVGPPTVPVPVAAVGPPTVPVPVTAAWNPLAVEFDNAYGAVLDSPGAIGVLVANTLTMAVVFCTAAGAVPLQLGQTACRYTTFAATAG